MLDASAYSSLICPFPSEVNALAGVANQHMLQWAAAFNLIPDQYTLTTRLQRMNYGWLAARVHPTASPEALQIVTNWMCWLFCLDDENDETQYGLDAARMERLHTRFLAILDGGLPTPADGGIERGLAHLHARMRRAGSPQFLSRFRQRVADYFTSIRWEAKNRIAQIVPDPITYCRMRLDTSGLYTCFELIDITEKIALPAAVRDHPLVQQITRMANNVTSWCNDIVSLPKELRHGDVHNLAIVLQHAHHLSIEDALRMAIERHNAEINAYVALEPQLPSFGPEVDAQLQRYLRGLRSWMRGNLDWGLTAKRYSTKSIPGPNESSPALAPIRLYKSLLDG